MTAWRRLPGGWGGKFLDRFEVRRTLQGINLSLDGIAVTDGRQLLHLPVDWSLKTNLTLPFPHALLAAVPQGPGKLWCWGDCFKLEVGSFSWIGRCLGNYPNWKQVIPEDKTLDYRITLLEPETLSAFLKTVPDHPPYHGIEFNVTPQGIVVIPMDFPGMELKVDAEFTGVRPRAVLSLNKYTLLRMLQAVFAGNSAFAVWIPTKRFATKRSREIRQTSC